MNILIGRVIKGIEDFKKTVLSVSMAITSVSKCLCNDCVMDTPKRFRRRKKVGQHFRVKDFLLFNSTNDLNK